MAGGCGEGGGDNDDVLHDCDDEKHEGDGHDVVF